MSLFREARLLGNNFIVKQPVKGMYVGESIKTNTENILVQNLVLLFTEYIERKIQDIHNFLFRLKFQEDKISDYAEWLDEVKRTEQGFKTKGLQILYGIIVEINKRRISSDEYKLLRNIIINQLKIANKILEKDLDLERLEEMVVYIKEAPKYMKFDLGIDFFPYVSQKREIKIEEHEYKQLKHYYNIA
jgi:hypothetical protein